ncbi:hypothetical protein [Burkholderia glumae]|uniref:Uncharacterized protein n=1 Tax=Burkholderia glumae TaxID=337 RepID=A0AAP9XZ68_BURGL|nr:hypothetical protein [Burkholderia glumae]ACR30793.1 Hypothetical protein bglu_2g03320 [Burkholderia glumae BGR1]AJY64714.1 hypothetical protein KS03_5588 [Burkholderia glumae LMG 2196 = ATCC 33617]KHJ59710.1 hypothetical protein NCPPB3923_27930 [Burkholderia glumae]MCM2483899.1 hypothetical protein [Burkholderia glumae]MCM2509593.1 hypothetical protein [Burkholderia glumae]
MTRYRGRWIAKLLLFVVAVAVLGRIVMALWNWVVPELVTGAHPIDYPHALGLLVLSRILFGGFRGHGGCRERRHWQHWQRLTQDERDRLRGALAAHARRDGGTGA